MTVQQIGWITLAYVIELAAVIYFTRATPRRVLGALAGGAVAGALLFGAILFGERLGLWHVPMTFTPVYMTVFYVGAAIPCAPIYLVTWRIARRWGESSLAIVLVLVALIGPPRDYFIASLYPAWITFAPGVLPVLAVAATYVSFVAVGHAVMRLVAGPANADRLASRSRDAVAPAG